MPTRDRADRHPAMSATRVRPFATLTQLDRSRSRARPKPRLHARVRLRIRMSSGGCQTCNGARARLIDAVPSTTRVYRVLYEVRPKPGSAGADPASCSVVSVAVPADHADRAQELSRQLLAPHGYEPLGTAIRTSDLTALLHDSLEDADDSGYGEYAARWLSEVHAEALREGSSVQLLSSDYGFLNPGDPDRQHSGA